jgi:UDP-N-acetylglucosamine 2-epimerase (non-hydrolysing)
MTSPRDESLIATNSQLSSPSSKQRILVIFGTRPEAVKLCPLIAALRSSRFCSGLETIVCVTAQHRQMLDQVLSAFEVRPDYDLDLMQPGQTLAALNARLLSGLEPVFAEVKPALAIVQGDTTTTLAGAFSAFYARVPLAHVEAGLRTFDLHSPYPEEMNRVMAGRLAALHFAATDWAAANLMREGIAADAIQVTGNTGIDAVLAIRDALEAGTISDGNRMPVDDARKLVVVTAHRRESFGAGFAQICQAIAELADRPDIRIVWPVHPNPNVTSVVNASLHSRPNVQLIEPLDYVPFIDLMRRAYLLITDSGGVQEEGPSLGKPILVLRDKTERPEAVEAGTVKLVGTERAAIVREAVRLLEDRAEYERMARLHNPYGDGRACGRIAERIASYLDAVGHARAAGTSS